MQIRLGDTHSQNQIVGRLRTNILLDGNSGNFGH